VIILRGKCLSREHVLRRSPARFLLRLVLIPINFLNTTRHTPTTSLFAGIRMATITGKNNQREWVDVLLSAALVISVHFGE